MVKNSIKKFLSSIKSKLFIILPSALLILFNGIVFGAATIYRGNTSEFGIDLLYALELYALPFIILLFIFLGIGILLSRRFLSIYVSLIFTLAILLWTQGNLLVWEYGVFDGLGIEWSRYSWQGWVDVGLWIILLILAIIFHRKISRIASFASLLLIFLQGIVLIPTYFTAPQTWSSNFSNSSEFPEGLLNYSSKFNIIHVILDGLQTDIFQEVVEENSMSSGLDGFVLFTENMATMGTTVWEIPVIFSGDSYQRDRELASYMKEALSEKGFQNILFKKGYDVNLVPCITMPGENFTNYYKIPKAYGGSRKEKDIAEAARLMDIVLFRHLPHFLKKGVYNNQNWTVCPIFVSNKNAGSFYYKYFFQDYIDNFQVKTSRPVYHFLHLYPPHPPFSTGKDCECVGKILPFSMDNYKIEVKCILRLFMRFIDRLKAHGIYDSSFIILQADHGQGLQVKKMRNRSLLEEKLIDVSPKIIGRSLALLAIKAPNKKGPLRISKAQTTLADIPSTIMDMVGFENPFKGVPVFQIDPDKDRERWYKNRFKVIGSVYDYKSWKKEKRVLSSKQMHADIYKWGAAIQFGFLGNAEPYQIEGWSRGSDGFTWTNGHSASLTIPITMPKSPFIILRARLMPYVVPGKVDKQTVHIFTNGKKAGQWIFTKRGIQEVALIVPKSLFTNPNRVVITFNMPDAISPSTVGYSNDKRTLSFGLISLRLIEQGTYQYGSIIKFGLEGNAEPYQTEGWSRGSDGYTWTNGHSASLTIPITVPKSPSITLKANLRAAIFPGKVDQQKVYILVNDKNAGEWAIKKRGFQDQKLLIPKTLFTNPNRVVITFNTPDAISPSKVGYSNDKRVLGIAVRSITLNQ